MQRKYGQINIWKNKKKKLRTTNSRLNIAITFQAIPGKASLGAGRRPKHPCCLSARGCWCCQAEWHFVLNVARLDAEIVCGFTAPGFKTL